MDIEILIEQIESVLGETPDGVPIVQVRRQEPAGDAIWFEKIARLASAIERFAPPRSAYRRICDEIIRLHEPPANSKQTAERLRAVLIGLKEDLAEQNLKSTEEIIHADVLTDLLGMADRMISDGFKDPAAVLAGSILAEHLRRLVQKHGFVVTKDLLGQRIPKNVDDMNHELAAADVYTIAEERQVAEWNSIRKHALVGTYDRYTVEQTRNMTSGIRLFLSRNPA